MSAILAGLGILGALLVSYAAGWALIRLLGGSERADALLLTAMAFGAGSGISSVLLFVWSLVFYPTFQPGAFIGLDIAIAAGLVCLAAAKGWAGKLHTQFEEIKWVLSHSGSKFSLFIGGVLGIYLASQMVSFAAQNPNGLTDAWAIWNLRAKSMFYGGATWRYFYQYQAALSWAHPDYPLLLPALVARCWIFAQRYSRLAPILIAAVFIVCTLLALFYGLYKTRGPAQAWIGALVLAGTPAFAITLGLDQYADAPLAYYYLGACVLLFLAEEQQQSSLYVLAGIFAGLAMWTKNEGAAFALSVVLARAVVVLFRSGSWRKRLRSLWPLKYIALGWLPVGIVVFLFKVDVSRTTTDLFNQSIPSMVSKVLDGSRYLLILGAFKEQFLSFGDLRFPLGIFPLLLVFAILAGFRWAERSRLPILNLLLTLAFTLAQYFVIYVITPDDLSWQLSTSLWRLIQQLYPAFLFLVFTVVNNPLDFQSGSVKGEGQRDQV